MKIYAEFENGERHELREIQGLQPDCKIVFIRVNSHFRPEYIERMESELSAKIGKKVVILDVQYGDVFVM